MSDPTDTKPWLTRQEVADLLGVRIETVSRAYMTGQLKGVKFGKVYRFHIDDLNALREYRTTKHSRAMQVRS